MDANHALSRRTFIKGVIASGAAATSPDPTRQELAHGVSGNLCRCQDYDKILIALARGADYMRRATWQTS